MTSTTKHKRQASRPVLPQPSLQQRPIVRPPKIRKWNPENRHDTSPRNNPASTCREKNNDFLKGQQQSKKRIATINDTHDSSKAARIQGRQYDASQTTTCRTVSSDSNQSSMCQAICTSISTATITIDNDVTINHSFPPPPPSPPPPLKKRKGRPPNRARVAILGKLQDQDDDHGKMVDNNTLRGDVSSDLIKSSRSSWNRHPIKVPTNDTHQLQRSRTGHLDRAAWTGAEIEEEEDKKYDHQVVMVGEAATRITSIRHPTKSSGGTWNHQGSMPESHSAYSKRDVGSTNVSTVSNHSSPLPKSTGLLPRKAGPVVVVKRGKQDEDSHLTYRYVSSTTGVDIGRSPKMTQTKLDVCPSTVRRNEVILPSRKPSVVDLTSLPKGTSRQVDTSSTTTTTTTATATTVETLPVSSRRARVPVNYSLVKRHTKRRDRQTVGTASSVDSRIISSPDRVPSSPSPQVQDCKIVFNILRRGELLNIQQEKKKAGNLNVVNYKEDTAQDFDRMRTVTYSKKRSRSLEDKNDSKSKARGQQQQQQHSRSLQKRGEYQMITHAQRAIPTTVSPSTITPDAGLLTAASEEAVGNTTIQNATARTISSSTTARKAGNASLLSPSSKGRVHAHINGNTIQKDTKNSSPKKATSNRAKNMKGGIKKVDRQRKSPHPGSSKDQQHPTVQDIQKQSQTESSLPVPKRTKVLGAKSLVHAFTEEVMVPECPISETVIDLTATSEDSESFPSMKNKDPKSSTGSKVVSVERNYTCTKAYADPSNFISVSLDTPDDDLLSQVEESTSTKGSKRRKLSTKKKKSFDVALSSEERKALELTKGNDIDLIQFQSIQRINISEEIKTTTTTTTVKEQMTYLRNHGIPFVITGHSTWPWFTSRWVKDTNHASDEVEPVTAEEGNQATSQQTNISKKQLIVQNLIDDIGEEDVPIVEKNYDELNPVKSVIKASAFIRDHWFGVDDDTDMVDHPNEKGQFYMQQWQFTGTPVAELLCGDDDCKLPDRVLHDDLLTHWLNEGGNPFQYLFMGSAGTMSRLHKDPGGLDVLIAPIVGEKECILVHRDDGKYLYDCKTNLDMIDLNRFPFTACATRIWKTIIQPGELLVMPHDTYHQCRNLTPCLSYHRLHLDYINLPGFFTSMLQKDDKCNESIDHEEIIWNCVDSLCDKVDDFVDEYREAKTKKKVGAIMNVVNPPPIDPEDSISALRLLRTMCLHLSSATTSPTNGKGRLQLTDPQFSTEAWINQMREVDKTLFNYRHRDTENLPRFRSRSTPVTGATESDEELTGEDAEKIEYSGKWCLDPAYESLLTALKNLPPCKPDEEDVIISDSICIEQRDIIELRLPEVYRCTKAVITKKKENMEALYVSYDDLPTEFDEFLPIKEVHGYASSSLSRKRISGGVSSTTIRPALMGYNQASAYQTVRCVPSGTKKKQDAKVIRRRIGTFYYVTLDLGPDHGGSGRTIKRWISRDMIIRKLQKDVKCEKSNQNVIRA